MGASTVTIIVLSTAVYKGVYIGVIVWVADVKFSARISFDVVVLDPLMLSESVVKVIIRDQVGGGGLEVGDEIFVFGGSVMLYAVGYDVLLKFVKDVFVLWSITGTLEIIS